jgi:ferric-dicitrate binding protein FerR (iron transport regulator)
VKKAIGIMILILAAVGLPAFAAETASIVYLEGTVTLNGSPATVGDDVPAGALVQTGQDSICQIVFNARNIIHLAAGTSLRLDPAVVSRGATLQKGTIAMVLRNLAPSRPGEVKFTIRTSSTVAGVRGTCFLVKVEDDNNTYICCCNGSIHLEGTGGEFTRNLAAPHHREVRVTKSSTGLSMAAAPMLYHSDADVEAIAARIGEKIDWSKIDK